MRRFMPVDSSETPVATSPAVPLESWPMLFDLAHAVRRHRWSLFALAGLILALQVSRAHVHRFGEHDALYGHSHATEMHMLDMDAAADGHELVSEVAVIDDLLIKLSHLGQFIPAVLAFLLVTLMGGLGLRPPPAIAIASPSFSPLRPPLRAPPR